jgi:hypothetical protein
MLTQSCTLLVLAAITVATRKRAWREGGGGTRRIWGIFEKIPPGKTNHRVKSFVVGFEEKNETSNSMPCFAHEPTCERNKNVWMDDLRNVRGADERATHNLTSHAARLTQR